MIGRGSLGQAVRLLGAATVVPLGYAPAFAQAVPAAAPAQQSQPAEPPTQVQSPPDAAELDPSAPIAPMPDLGVDWPDLNARDSNLPATAAPSVAASAAENISQLKYAWTIEGLGNLGDSAELLQAFRHQSALEADRKNPANAAQIGRRSRADSELLVQLLRSQGYYDAMVEPRTERSGDGLSVILTAEPGQQYRFASVELPGLEQAGEDASKLRNAFAVKAGDPVIAEDVTSAGLTLTTALGQEGFAEAKLGDQDIEVNHQTHLATLVQPVTPGPVARFGTIHVSGKPPFSARHVAIIARFRRGDVFKRSKLEDLRRALISTSLVAVADIRVVPVNGGRTVDIDVHLEPAPSHTIAGQLGYGTGQGISAEVDWTNRNMFNPEGALTLRGIAGTQEQLAAVQYRRNNFLQRDQVLNLATSIGHQKYAAYQANTIELSGDIERQSNFIWQKKWTWTYGVDLLGTDEQGVFSSAGIKSTRKFAIAALPLSLGYDGSDNLLDPTRGFRLSGRISPEISFHGGSFTYARTQIDASAYQPISEGIVLAGRVRFGTIIGASLFDIAPSRRFYSGGGGSVRGYGYQQLGPRDVDGDPIGGRGLAEFGLETRIRLRQFGGNFGIVPFFDGGTLSTRAMPDFSSWRYAVGLGARYYSSFGPIRIDFGIPLNRRQGDGPIAVTVSLGQAFEMAEADAFSGGSQPGPVRLRSDWKWRLLNELFAAFVALLFLLAGALVLLDSAPGHRFIIDRLSSFETASGLKIRIGRIDGSIFGKSQLRNVAVFDQSGLFLTSPNIKLDWSPGAWLQNKLSIDSVTADRVSLVRLPKLKPSAKQGPILPGFDIHVGDLRVDHLDVGAQVSGQARSGSLRGKADVHKGRALVEVAVVMNNGGDHLAFHLDAEPDRNRFDIAGRIASPANGLVPAILGTPRAINLQIGGKGSWLHWRGNAALDLSGKPTARLALGLDQGRYRLQGQWDPAQFLTGKFERLTFPVVNIRGDATFDDRILDGELIATTPELRAVARGAVDLVNSRYRSLRLGIDLLKPPALFRNMTGKSVRMVWTLDGPFATADYSYRLMSSHVQFDNTGFDELRAEGRGRLAPSPIRVPILLGARHITGIGDVAGAMFDNPKIQGWLSITPRLVRGDNLVLTSARWNGRLSVLIDLVTGRFEVLASGAMKRYLIPGLGIVDVITDLRVVPGPNDKGSHVVGTTKAWVRRLDNAFFRDLTGGLPSLTTNLERGNDGIVRLTNLQLYSPKLRLSGAGLRFRDGTFHIVASGRQAKYGPLRMVLDGHIERPKVDLLLDHPNDALGLTAMRLLLVPIAEGFDYKASGGSRLGPFTSGGQIRLPHNAPAVIAIAALDAGVAHASGDLRSDPGGFSGRLTLKGGSLAGTLDFSPSAGAQRIEAHLIASNAAFPGAFAVRTGRADGTIVLADQRTTVDGVVDARGLEMNGITLARLTANAKLVNGSGQVRAAFAGRRGANFEFSTLAQIEPDTVRLTGNGRIERQSLVINQAAILTRSEDGWELAPTKFNFAGGTATVSGRSGSRPEIHARVEGMPLEVLDIAWPKLDLSGSASGQLDYAWKGNRSGRLDLKVRGLSRAGLVLASKPIDFGIAAVVNGNQAALRAVAASDGTIVGRAQARFSPLGSGPLMAELLDAPLFAQLRYAGPADTLWRLTGSEVLDMSGPLAVGADIGGRLADPQIHGSLRTQSGRLESQVTGMVITNVSSEAHFSGSQLIFSKISGATPGGGSISGNGTVTFSEGRTALDLSFNASQALLLNRDDVAARVTGPAQIRSDGQGGTISGDFKLNKGRFQLGKASAGSSVPQLNVREVGLEPEDVIESSAMHPWKLSLKVSGNDLQVIGLGLNSRWTTNLEVGGLADSPRFTGTAELVQGDYDFAGRRFRVDRGTIRFHGESPVNPQIDIRASAQVQGLDATIMVGGSGLKPEITFASTPPLPQDELLSRILFGTSITNLSAPEALQLASAVAALQSGSGSLDPINALRRAIGLDRLRIVPADVTTGQKTAIAAGKYVTRRLFVEVVTDGQGYSATQVEYQMTRWLSLLSTVSTIGRSSASVRISKDY